MTILRTVAACTGVVVAFVLIGLGGWWLVLGFALYVVSATAVESA